MRSLIATFVRLSPSRALLVFVIFCAACISSCAAGKVEDIHTEPTIDAGPKLTNISNLDVSRVTFTPDQDAGIVTDDARSSIDVTIMANDVALPSTDRGSLTIITLDAGQAEIDVPLPPEDVAPISFDTGVTATIDIPRPDIPPPFSDVSSVSDRGARDVGQAQDASMLDVRPPPTPELCNGRDDDGNGLIDEIFECSVGRRGNTCVTSCGANGFQLCTTNCRWNPVCQTYAELCNDTIDNDCNGRVDCADTACRNLPQCEVIPPPPIDAGRTDGCRTLIIRLDLARLPTCSSGRVIILYDSEGYPHESRPGAPLTVDLCGALRGALVVSTRCGGEYLRDWPGSAGQSVRAGGVASITLDGDELADGESLLCFDRFSPTPGVRPMIPLERFFYGRCP